MAVYDEPPPIDGGPGLDRREITPCSWLRITLTPDDIPADRRAYPLLTLLFGSYLQEGGNQHAYPLVHHPRADIRPAELIGNYGCLEDVGRRSVAPSTFLAPCGPRSGDLPAISANPGSFYLAACVRHRAQGISHDDG